MLLTRIEYLLYRVFRCTLMYAQIGHCYSEVSYLAYNIAIFRLSENTELK